MSTERFAPAEAALKAGRVEEGVALIEASLREDPQAPLHIYRNFTALLIRHKQYERAATWTTQAVGVDVAALPPTVDSHPVFELARLSVRREPAEAGRAPAAGAINTLLAVERWTPDAAGGEALVFDAGAGRFRTPQGAPADPPARVGKLVFRTAPGLIAADAVALLAQGVAWESASA